MGLLSKNDGPGLQIKRIDSWHDYGSNENYIKLIQKFVNQNLIKNDEFTYIHNDTVYKYNVDENVIKNKIYRAKKLSKFIPNLEKTTANFYSYRYVEGNLLNEEKSKAVFLNFLNNISVPWDLTCDEIIYCMKGTFRLTCNGESYICNPGDVLYVPRDNHIAYECDEKCIIFYAAYPHDWKKKAGLTHVPGIDPEDMGLE